MEIFPAIDLKGGQVVRLTRGDYDQVQVYSQSPARIAAEFKKAGAGNLHAVDLEGARDGVSQNFEAIGELAGCGLFLQVGGGIRDEAAIVRHLEAGVKRVILGTKAVEDPAFLKAMVKKYSGAIAVSVDARDEKVAVEGWTKTSGLSSVDFCRKLEQIGVQTVIYTDISKDGVLGGTNLEIYQRLSREVSLNIIASGGVSFLEEIAALKESGVYGAIIGKALYAGSLNLREVLENAH
ncbi:1-(5-phosphoribosyl)-5-[(5-phosphoribosylamino)methylideneamino]imidazole-4-carboxamide isomerase [Oscillospiraceae bacterium MB08-C2-2]|nr:1-(5-phosphoribosyl)-5-[(5-phosphoribosylamino)methylideneamino]imidazole-4-carboxamide isomerase [Oscillospiraceae bacterium MB08-C2-2]